MKAILPIGSLMFIAYAHAFQVDSNINLNDQKAVEKLYKLKPESQTKVAQFSNISISAENIMLPVLDDTTYSRRLPLFSGWFPFLEDMRNDHRAKPLSETINMKFHVPSSKKKQYRRSLPAMDDDPAEYWYHNKIHTFGNTGLLGAFHAVMAPVATKLIDTFAYSGRNIRSQVAELLRDVTMDEFKAKNKKAFILDMCCGVGMSTRALRNAFQESGVVVGLDTSPEMISFAKINENFNTTASSMKEHVSNFFVNFDKSNLSTSMKQSRSTVQYARGNAERTKFPAKTFDIITIWYGFHEIPLSARYRILREVRRLLKSGGVLCILDIEPSYDPSPSMLAGEPYVLEYKKNIMNQLRSVQGYKHFSYRPVVEGHAGMWLLKRK